MDVKFTDNSPLVSREFAGQAEKALEAIGRAAEGYAKANCPVDTGRLRNSIAYAVEGSTVYIGTNVEYAPPVEYLDRRHKTGRAHFLRDAASTHGEEYKRIAEAAMKGV